MITSLVAMLICYGNPGQAQAPKWKAIDLPTKTRPYVEIEKFKKMEFTRVQEVETQAPGSTTTVIARYYYFTYKARFEEEAKLWEILFPKSKGWTDQSPVVGSLFLGQKVDHPKISDHGLILNSGTTEPHPDKPNLRIHVPNPDWVCVSLFETLKR